MLKRPIAKLKLVIRKIFDIDWKAPSRVSVPSRSRRTLSFFNEYTLTIS